MTYKAIVCEIRTRPHPNADRVQLGTCMGHQVVVGLDTKDGEIGVFFPTDGQLSKEFCDANNLSQFDEKGNRTSQDFFDKNRRVKAQSFRGQKSDGYWVPLSYFDYLIPMNGDEWPPQQGTTFDHLLSEGGVRREICNKYVTAHTQAAAHVRGPKRMNCELPEHVETEQIRYYVNNLQDGDIVTITYKLHGTSGRLGNVLTLILENRELSWWEKLLNVFRSQKIFPIKMHEEYKHQIGTRRTLLTDTMTGFYGSEQFRRDAVSKITLKEDEIIYYELVGYVDEDRLIMSRQNVMDKNLAKRYGNTMAYTYGCNRGECKLFVYRITQHGIELSWDQVRARCVELGLETVPEIGRMVWNRDFTEENMAYFESLVNGSGQDALPEPLDPRHILEGIVIRVDSIRGTEFYKLKSWVFGVLEGYIKDNPEYVDMEESN